MDEELFSQLNSDQKSDEAAFHRFGVPEISTLLRVDRSLFRTSHDAEDLVRDAVLLASQGTGNFDGTQPRAWLFRILRDTHINRNARQRPVDFDVPNDAQSVTAAEGSNPTQ